MTTAQKRGLESILPLYAVPIDAPLDAAATFARRAPLGVEIGFGTGDALVQWAMENPDWNLLGVEVYPPGIGAAVNRLAELTISNVRIAPARAEAFIATALADGEAREFRIFFPDPWPKKRHAKRRLIQVEFVALLARKLESGGIVRLATDWDAYAEWSTVIFGGNAAFRSVEAADAAFARNVTRFERRGLRLGHRIHEQVYVRV
ncbi:MAG: tRNA (guanosine(46)-N7)-methyltransferase TrmB [Pseudomonadales bacterium]|nr:tRNA (guanosine(46)-N7)-methyltransferase TrmB [Pseudomonadales bacterium]MCP5183428.1 tRNA (guanosine(46)-N7)-methyltransferase TrmB [Pseudomonadales bacterium]